jgi:hypothetical protein
MGSLAAGALRLFSLDFPLLGEVPPSLYLYTLDLPSASLCDCVISTVLEGCPCSFNSGGWLVGAGHEGGACWNVPLLTNIAGWLYLSSMLACLLQAMMD